MKNNAYNLIGHCKKCLFLLLITTLSACLESEKSEGIISNEIYMKIDFTQEVGSNDTMITAFINRDNSYGNRIKLSDGEELIVSNAGVDVNLEENDSLLGIGYEGLISDSANDKFIAVFRRSDGTEVKSEITMPSSFDVMSPLSGDNYYEGDDLFVTWSPSLINTEITIHGHIACTTIEEDLEIDTDNENETWTISDTGNFDLPLGVLASNMRLEVFLGNDELLTDIPCDFDVDVSRENEKDLNNFYAQGSTITATKITSVQNMNFYINY